jgi:hypothetical protein
MDPQLQLWGRKLLQGRPLPVAPAEAAAEVVAAEQSETLKDPPPASYYKI